MQNDFDAKGESVIARKSDNYHNRDSRKSDNELEQKGKEAETSQQK